MTILQQVPSKAKIRTELKSIVFGKVLRCPHCGFRKLKKYEKRYHCKRCRKFFSLTSNTWLKGMKLPLQTFWLLLWCWINKVPIDQAQNTCGISEPTVRNWYEKFRHHLPQDNLDILRLKGNIQMDEAYRGSKDNKYAIIGAKQAKSDKRKAILQVIPKKSVDRKDAVDFLSQNVVPDSNLWSDGAAIYKGIAKWWPVNHSYELHNKFEFALTSEIEGMWGNFFTFVRRMYHHVTKDKIESVVREFNFRFCFPEHFRDPSSYLKIALKSLAIPVVEKKIKTEEKQIKISLDNMFIYTLNPVEKSKVLVPSC